MRKLGRHIFHQNIVCESSPFFVTALCCAIVIAPASSVGVVSGVLYACCVWLLLLIAVVDARTMHIPDVLNAAFLAVAIVYSAVQFGRVDIVAPFVAVAFFTLQWLVSRGRLLGSGDIFFAAGIAIFLADWRRAVIWLLCSYIVGAIVSLWLIATRRAGRCDRIAFAPFLAIGAVTSSGIDSSFLQVL